MIKYFFDYRNNINFMPIFYVKLNNDLFAFVRRFANNVSINTKQVNTNWQGTMNLPFVLT